MQSLRELYKIGNGPSSSHTMGPKRAALIFRQMYPESDFFRVYLYGSLALTGRGHLTDKILLDTFAPYRAEVVFDPVKKDLKHENTLDLHAYKNGNEIGFARVYSVGGGSIEFEGEAERTAREVYALSTFSQITEYCVDNSMDLADYVLQNEPDILGHLELVWRAMKDAIKRGLAADGVLPGELNLPRKAKYLLNQSRNETPAMAEQRIVSAYAYAVAEENASGGVVVTAPTCGSSGILPAVLKYSQEQSGYTDNEIFRALCVGGIIGNLIKTNASISGAECGCQAEVGSACAMTAAALSYLRGMNLHRTGYAAEIALEHSLGLTCDPVFGLVQIPCIERNAVGAVRAINASNLAYYLPENNKVSLDTAISTMYQTGRDLSALYRETALGGLARAFES